MNLLKIEWLKLRKYNTFWILSSLFAGLFLLWNYGVNKSFISTGKGSVNLFSSTYSFPQIWGNMGYIYSWFVIFLCVFVIISISNEFSFRTHRQHVIDGMERLNFLNAKAFLVLSIALSATFFFILTGLLFGFMNGGGNPFVNFEKVGYVFLYTLNYLSFSAFIAFFIKRSGLSIMLLLAYFLIEAIISGLINWKFDTYIGNLLPLQSSDELLPLNALKTLNNLAGNTQIEAPIYLLVAASVIYISLYYILLRRKLLTTDL